MLSIIAWIASIILPGLGLGAWLYPRRISGLRFLGLVFGFGSALLSLELFLYFVVFRLTAGPGLFWLAAVQVLAGGLIFARRFPWTKQLARSGRSGGWLAWLLGGLVALALLLSLLQALARPPVAFDSIAFWAMRGEMLRVEGRVDFDSQSPIYLSALSHRNYPWHLSLLEYWTRAVGVSGGAINLIAWSYFISLVLLVLDFCIKRLGRWQGLALAFLLATQPLLFYHASNNYADLIVGYYAAAGFIFFLEWLETKASASLLLAAALTGWTFSVKNYGSFYIIAFGFGLGLAWLLRLWRPTVRSGGTALLALTLPIAPIILFKGLLNLDLHNSPAAWVWRPDALQPFLTALFLDNNWNIWWVVFGVVFVLLLPAIRRQKELLVPWAMFGCLIAILMVIFTTTENYQWALDHTALPRSFIPLVPLSILLAAFSFRHARTALCKTS